MKYDINEYSGVATISQLHKIIGLFCKTFAKDPYKRDCILQKRPNEYYLQSLPDFECTYNQDARIQRYRETKTQRNRETERHGEPETQGHEGIETQRYKNT